MRNLTMVKGASDAPCHRMKRLILARLMTQNTCIRSCIRSAGIRSSRCLRILPIFPDFRKFVRHNCISFTQGDWSAHAAIAILRSRDVPAPRAAEQQGCLKQLALLIPIIGGRKAGMRKPASDQTVVRNQAARTESRNLPTSS